MRPILFAAEDRRSLAHDRYHHPPRATQEGGPPALKPILGSEEVEMPSKPRTRRDPAKERSWRQIIRRQQRSGLSVRAFCEEKGVEESVFRRWQAKPRRR